MATALLDPEIQEKFLNILPIPNVMDATQGDWLDLQISQTQQWLGLIPTAQSIDFFARAFGRSFLTFSS